jgi:hypothetical protein
MEDGLPFYVNPVMQKDVHFRYTLAIMLASEVLSTYFVDSNNIITEQLLCFKTKGVPLHRR